MAVNFFTANNSYRNAGGWMDMMLPFTGASITRGNGGSEKLRAGIKLTQH